MMKVSFHQGRVTGNMYISNKIDSVDEAKIYRTTEKTDKST